MGVNRDGVTTYVGLMKGDALNRFGTMAIGSGSTAEAETDSQLVSELSGNGTDRKAAAVSLAGTNNERLRFVATYALTDQVVVREASINNDIAPLAINTGDQIIREVFNKDYNAIPGDTITMTIDLIGSDVTVQPSGSSIVVTNGGVEQAHKLAGVGLDTSAGTWTTLALGRGTAAPSATDSSLVDEIVAADGLNLGRDETVTLTVSLVSTNGFTDTVRTVAYWEIETVGTPAVDVGEVSVETSTTVGSGITAARQVFDAVLSLDGEYQDTYQHTFDHVVSIA